MHVKIMVLTEIYTVTEAIVFLFLFFGTNETDNKSHWISQIYMAWG